MRLTPEIADDASDARWESASIARLFERIAPVAFITAFVPSLLIVPVGSAVSFPNEDPFFHNVFSYSSSKRFDLGRYPRGEVSSFALKLSAASSRPNGRADWDHDIARYEIGVGYRLALNAGLLGTFMHNENEELPGGDPDDDLFAVRLWWAF